MKNAKKIGDIGQLLMILGSAMYLIELLFMKLEPFTESSPRCTLWRWC